MCKFIKLERLDLLGTISERAVILYSLISDRLSWSKFRDAENKTYCCFTIEEVADIFKISQTQAKQAFKELETAQLIIRRRSGQGKASKIYSAVQTDGIPPVKTDGFPPVKTDGFPPPIQTNINRPIYSSSSGGEICENQMTFDDFFLEMTVHDTIGKIIAEIVTENQQEFSEITAEIADFVAKRVIKAAENKKIANIRGYARAALRHGVSDYAAACSGRSNTSYGATYDIAAYESVSAADSDEWN